MVSLGVHFCDSGRKV